MRPGSSQFSVPRENFDYFEPEKKPILQGPLFAK